MILIVAGIGNVSASYTYDPIKSNLVDTYSAVYTQNTQQSATVGKSDWIDVGDFFRNNAHIGTVDASYMWSVFQGSVGLTQPMGGRSYLGLTQGATDYTGEWILHTTTTTSGTYYMDNGHSYLGHVYPYNTYYASANPAARKIFTIA